MSAGLVYMSILRVRVTAAKLQPTTKLNAINGCRALPTPNGGLTRARASWTQQPSSVFSFVVVRITAAKLQQEVLRGARLAGAAGRAPSRGGRPPGRGGRTAAESGGERGLEAE